MIETLIPSPTQIDEQITNMTAEQIAKEAMSIDPDQLAQVKDWLSSLPEGEYTEVVSMLQDQISRLTMPILDIIHSRSGHLDFIKQAFVPDQPTQLDLSPGATVLIGIIIIIAFFSIGLLIKKSDDKTNSLRDLPTLDDNAIISHEDITDVENITPNN